MRSITRKPGVERWIDVSAESPQTNSGFGDLEVLEVLPTVAGEGGCRLHSSCREILLQREWLAKE